MVSRGTAGLLWEAGRIEPRPASVRAALDAGCDGSLAASLARAHGLGPMLWRALGVAGCRDLFGRAGTELAMESAVCRHRASAILPKAVSAAVTPLVDAGFEPLVFKGPALASRYPEPGLRPMGDIDLVLPADQHDPGIAALQRAGWRVLRPADRRRYETVLVHDDVPGLYAELHKGLDTWHNRANGLRAATLWCRRVPVDCLGTPAFGLRPEDELVALAAHAGKPYHHFSRMIWTVDLAVVEHAARTTGAGIDWELVRHLAGAWRCRTVLAVALSHAARVGLAAPAELTLLEGSTLRRASLAPLFDELWPLVDHDAGLRNRLRYALADDWTHRVMLFTGAPALTPVRAWPGEYARLGYQAVRRAWRLQRLGRHPAEDATPGL